MHRAVTPVKKVLWIPSELRTATFERGGKKKNNIVARGEGKSCSTDGDAQSPSGRRDVHAASAAPPQLHLAEEQIEF